MLKRPIDILVLGRCFEFLRRMSRFPKYTPSERLADGCIHVLGVTASVVAISALIIYATPDLSPLSTVSLVIYGIATIVVFTVSAGYHLSDQPQVKEVLRRLDHAAIFMKIAGTYTPFALVKIGGVLGNGFIACIWCMAVIGAGMKVWRPRQYETLSLVLYLALGWAALVVLDPLIFVLSNDVLLLLAIGGVLYTIGVVFYLWEKLPYHNAIWHAFVLTGASIHYVAVFSAIAVA